MNNLNDQDKIIANTSWSSASNSSVYRPGKAALAIYIIAMVAVGSVLFIDYLLEAAIIVLVVGAIISMGRG